MGPVLYGGENDVRDTQSGVSYYDVRNLFKQVGGAHHGYVEALLYVPMRQELHHAIDVRVRFTRRAVGADGGRGERGISGVFPTGEARTLAGLLFQLATQLDIMLDEEEAAAKRAHQAALGI